jgi:tetratricopeptide (TPR) repeat protein
MQYQYALAQNVHGLILALADRPMSGAEECKNALEEFGKLNEIRPYGLALLNYGFCKRKHADSWKRDLHLYPTEQARVLCKEAEKALKKAIGIFDYDAMRGKSNKVNEPLRLWEGLNELGSLYTDWGWLERSLNNLVEAENLYQKSIKLLNRAIHVAEDHKLKFQKADSLDDLAQTYGDRSFLYKQLGNHAEAEDDRRKAEQYQIEAEVIVPEAFKVKEGQSMSSSDEPGQPYWLIEGKAHMWRGVWLLRDLETANNMLAAEKAEKVKQGMYQFLMATIYFRHYQGAFQFDRVKKYFIQFLQTAQIPPDQACQRILKAGEDYQEDFTFLVNTVENLLGY